MRHIARLLFFVLLASGAGCGGEESPNNENNNNGWQLCADDQVRCDESCIDPLTSSLFCGASGDCEGSNAGESCTGGFACNAGTCELSCVDAQTACGEACVDTKTDSNHCGACDAACGDGEVCNGSGVCELSCQSGLTNCNGTCRDLTTDGDHCGACDAACGDGEVCNGSGVCELSCQTGLTNCNGTCRDLTTDGNHCGACDAACGDGEVCNGSGVCELSCQSGLTECNGTCRDLTTDGNHCGTCDAPCGDGEVCNGSGVCELSCQSGLTNCNGTCRDLTTDGNHCGACDAPCGDGEVCNGGGVCELSCQTGLTECSGTCRDLTTDPNNCGTCNNACASGEVCNGSGVCELSCQTGLTECSGTCRDLTTDPNNCGTCNNACASGEVCNGSGVCELSCQTGLTECSGTCRDLTTDPNNCGTCNDACASGEVCSGSGVCELSCQNGLTECNGTCRDLTTDPNNCGTCNNACASGEVCSGSGVCELSCQTGLTECSGTCRDLTTDPNNCGTCNNACASGEVCSGSGVCELSCQNGLTECNGTCRDLTTDTNNCGTCGNMCLGLCVNGSCCGNGVVEAGEDCDDANADDTDGCTSTCESLTCFTQVTNSWDGVTTYQMSVPYSLWPTAWLDWVSSSVGIQPVNSKVDNLVVTDGSGNVLYTDSFDSNGSWIIRKGAIGTTNISGGTANMGSDWNIFYLGATPFPTANGLVISADFYWSATTSVIGFFLVDIDPAVNVVSANVLGGSHNLQSYASESGPDISSVFDTLASGGTIGQAPWASPSVGWHTMTVEYGTSCTCGDGVLDAGETCDDDNTISGDGCSASCQVEPNVSCLAILNAGQSTGDGVYPIDPDGNGSGPPVNVYCDMTTDGGGWALLSRGGGECAAALTPGAPSDTQTCAYLPGSQVQAIATNATTVRLSESSTTFASWDSEALGTNAPAIQALQTGGSWHNGATFDNWNFGGITCVPALANGWPNMFQACGNCNGVHWLADYKQNLRCMPPWSNVTATWVR